jgi:crotonobetainyl-CoA:carnitine CoA-transferase CaiB-like acyl-CoA transferase
LSAGIAGGYCTKLLADAGADVVKVEPEGGDRLRRWSATGQQVIGDGALFQFLHTSKRSITGSADDPEVVRLASRADMVVEDLELAELQATGLLGVPELVVVSISPYGRTGPWEQRPSAEFIIQAESGCISGRGVPHGEPFAIGGRVFEFAAGAYAAAAGLAAVVEARRSGRGEHVDVSVLESAAVAGFSGFSDLQARLEGVRPDHLIGEAQRVEIPSIEPTADGWVGFTTNSRQQFDDFLLLIDRPDLIVDESFAMATERWERFDEWNALVHAWTRARPTQEVIEQAVELRIPVAPVGTATTVTGYEHFVERQVFLPNPSGGFLQPRCPYRISGVERPVWRPVPAAGEQSGTIQWATPPERGTARRALPLEGIRVVDLTAWFAGPVAAQLMALLGADVVHVESIRRMDGMRAVGGTVAHRYADWWECSSMFLSANTDKLDVTIDLRTSAGLGVLIDLIRRADVVIENFTPRVMETFGLTWDALHEINPRLVVVRMPAFGLDGPWRDWTGFAQTMEQVTGLAWVTGHVDDQPRIQRGPCDILAGIHAVFATLVALQHRATTGKGAHVESTMVETALNAAAEQLVEYGAYGEVMGRQGNRSRWAAPQGLYRSGDRQWVALSIETDAQWASLCSVLDASEWVADAGLARQAGRRARHDELDVVLRAWAETHEGAAAVEILVSAGVPAGVVFDQRTLSTHPQLVAREFFEELDHPVVGLHRVAGPPFRYASVPRWMKRPAPTLGQHNHDVFEGLLGMTESEVKTLEADGIVGDRPAGL